MSINVQRDFPHLTSKMQSVLRSQYLAAGYDVVPFAPVVPHPVPPPAMLRTSPLDPPPFEPPRDCIEVYPVIAPGHALLCAYDRAGALCVELRLPVEWATPELEARLLAFVRASAPVPPSMPLRLVPD